MRVAAGWNIASETAISSVGSRSLFSPLAFVRGTPGSDSPASAELDRECAPATIAAARSRLPRQAGSSTGRSLLYSRRSAGKEEVAPSGRAPDHLVIKTHQLPSLERRQPPLLRRDGGALKDRSSGLSRIQRLRRRLSCSFGRLCPLGRRGGESEMHERNLLSHFGTRWRGLQLQSKLGSSRGSSSGFP
ncbi:hypothetical protein HPB49_016703 [Dermacentor silvarum]|uniref:Uncharacterized protein n=1 Tax=Dermacentor silvarum TaxID=543639 RepID=A0ACB8E1V2_DERSI|nr:hypothetical protein HPB49_016703 [Dermacentor silvarum]